MAMWVHRLVVAAAFLLTPAMLYPSVAHAALVTAVPADTSVTIGETVIVRIQLLSSFPDLEGFRFVYQYNPAVLEFLGAAPGEVLSGAPGATFGTVRPDYAAPADSAWYEGAVLDGVSAGPGILTYLYFKTVGPGNGALVCRGVDLRDSANQRTLATCFDAVIRVPGTTDAELAAAPGGLWFEPPRPNPARDAVTFRFAVPAAANVSLTIHDLFGRGIAELERGTMPAGAHTRTWAFRDGAGAVVPPGVYLAKLTAGSEMLTRAVIRVR